MEANGHQQPPINGQGAVDLGALRVTDQQKQQIANQLLTQAGLLCAGCGSRIRGAPVIYYILVDNTAGQVQGMPPGFHLQLSTMCKKECPSAVMLETQAIARREGLAGRITWLDERRAARAARSQGQG